MSSKEEWLVADQIAEYFSMLSVMYTSGRLAIHQADLSPSQDEAEEISVDQACSTKTVLLASYFTIHHVEYVIRSCHQKKQSTYFTAPWSYGYTQEAGGY